jgi:hypothetical protein
MPARGGRAHDNRTTATRKSLKKGENQKAHGGLSEARLSRMRDVMAGYVQRNEVPGMIAWSVGVERRTLILLAAGHPMMRQ